MSNQSIQLTPELYTYLLEVSLRESDLLQELRERTRQMPEARMQIAPDQGQFMTLLARLLGVRKALEIGVFTGYSALCVAAALPADGCLIACDISAEYTRIAQEYWARAGVADRIDLRLAPASETLAALLAEGAAGSFDLAFIDADKTGYAAYYERCLQLVRRNGLVAVDNTLWSGRVADPKVRDADTEALRAFNTAVAADERVDLCLVPIADGLTLLRKR